MTKKCKVCVYSRQMDQKTPRVCIACGLEESKPYYPPEFADNIVGIELSTLHAAIEKLTEENKRLKGICMENLEKSIYPPLLVEYESLKVENIALFNLIGEVLQEAQEHPQRLIAFNSPLLGMLMLKYYEHREGELSGGDLQAYNKFRAVVSARQE